MATESGLSCHPGGDEGSSDEEFFLLTQPVERPLAGVIAFVDVRSSKNKAINFGQTISDRLTGLGATIAPRLTKDVTHIVYKDGRTNLGRVDRKSVFVVSPLWVESCSRCNEQVSEAKYPVIAKETPSIDGGSSTAATTPVVLGRIKRIKSMQPKPFVEEEVTKSVERNRKRLIAITEESAKRSKKVATRLHPFEFLPTDDEEDNSTSIATESSTTKKPPTSSTKTLTKDIQSKKPKKKRRILQSRQQNAFVETVNKETKKEIKKPSTAPPPTELRETEKEKENESTNLRHSLPTTKPPLAVVKTEGYSSRKRGRSSFEKKQPGIVITSLNAHDRETVVAVVDSLGVFEVSKTVGENTTHVICGASRRTVNVLAGTAKGCWLLSIDWVWQSLEAGKWLPEGAFEMVSEFPAAQFFRLERCQAGLLYRPSLFHDVGSIYVSSNTKPVPQELEMLLSLAGAKLTGSKRKADVCVGRCQVPIESTVLVSEQWVIDSISEHRRLPLSDYMLDNHQQLLHEASPEL